MKSAHASSASRIAVLGLGGIGQRVLSSLHDSILPGGSFAALRRADCLAADPLPPDIEVFTDVAELEKWNPDLAIECAGHDVVAHVVPRLLHAGVDVMIVSIGALADEAVREALGTAARAGRAGLLTVSGAIGGLDALSAARAAGIASVRYTGRKPPQAWIGSPADQVCDLSAISQPTVVFEGSAARSARLYPKNANVTAAVALAGIGFEQTSVRLIADPTIDKNVHELEVEGAFGRFLIRLENNQLPENPRTSWLAVLSIEAELRKYLSVQ